jgi:hypothetical protein
MKIADGKVAGIVAPNMAAINVGSNQGVKVGDLVRVVREVEVEDPDSHEDLGGVVFTKVKLRVNYTDKRFSIAETVDYPNRGPLSSIYALSSITGDVETLKLTTNASSAGSGTVLIAIGDPAIVEREDKPADDKGRDAKRPPDRPKADSKK